MRLQRSKTDSTELFVSSTCKCKCASTHSRRGHTTRGAIRKMRTDPPAAHRRARVPAKAANPPGQTWCSLPGSPQSNATRP